MFFRSGFIVYLAATWKSETVVCARIPFDGVTHACFGKMTIQLCNHFRWRPVIGFSTGKVKLTLHLSRT